MTRDDAHSIHARPSLHNIPRALPPIASSPSPRFYLHLCGHACHGPFVPVLEKHRWVAPRTWERTGEGVAGTSVAMFDRGSGGEQRVRGGSQKRTVADIHPCCLREMSMSLDPDGWFRKSNNGCEADKQTKKSRALDLARGV